MKGFLSSIWLQDPLTQRVIVTVSGLKEKNEYWLGYNLSTLNAEPRTDQFRV